jgi:hypothetical protein
MLSRALNIRTHQILRQFRRVLELHRAQISSLQLPHRVRIIPKIRLQSNKNKRHAGTHVQNLRAPAFPHTVQRVPRLDREAEKEHVCVWIPERA